MRPSEGREILTAALAGRMDLFDLSERCVGSGEGTVMTHQDTTSTAEGFIFEAQDQTRGEVVDEAGQEWRVHGRVKPTQMGDGSEVDQDLQRVELDVREQRN